MSSPQREPPEWFARLPAALGPTRQRLDQFFNLVDDVVGAQVRLVQSAWQMWTRAGGSGDETRDNGASAATIEAPPAAAEIGDVPAETVEAGDVPAETVEAGDVPAEAAATGEASIDVDVPEEAVRARAYELYVQRGRQPGHESEDWERARAELRASFGKPNA